MFVVAWGSARSAPGKGYLRKNCKEGRLKRNALGAIARASFRFHKRNYAREGG